MGKYLFTFPFGSLEGSPNPNSKRAKLNGLFCDAVARARYSQSMSKENYDTAFIDVLPSISY